MELGFIDDGCGRQRTMMEVSWLYNNFWTVMCIVLDQFVDNNLIDMHGKNNSVKFLKLADISSRFFHK